MPAKFGGNNGTAFGYPDAVPLVLPAKLGGTTGIASGYPDAVPLVLPAKLGGTTGIASGYTDVVSLVLPVKFGGNNSIASGYTDAVPLVLPAKLGKKCGGSRAPSVFSAQSVTADFRAGGCSLAHRAGKPIAAMELTFPFYDTKIPTGTKLQIVTKTMFFVTI